MQKNEKNIIRVYATDWCSDCQRVKFLLDEYGVTYINVDVEQDEAGMAFVRRVNNGRRRVPTIVFPDGSIMVEPSSALLVEKLGLDL